jgi:hypothetical protein
MDSITALLNDLRKTDVRENPKKAYETMVDAAGLIEQLQDKIKRLEKQRADASWAEDYRRGMSF